ncbi:MAG: hypothetical protein JJT96_12495 [Opitutales bacterium]|nr:hypothetical protein [Opitutales bacterium]
MSKTPLCFSRFFRSRVRAVIFLSQFAVIAVATLHADPRAAEVVGPVESGASALGLVHWGDEGGAYAWERSGDLADWTVVGRSQSDVEDGERFLFEDRDFLFAVAPAFYRAVGGVPECALEWREDPAPEVEALGFAPFNEISWAEICDDDSADIVYTLRIHPTTPDGMGGLVALPGIWMEVPDISGNSWLLDPLGLPDLLPPFAFSVLAETPEWRVLSRPVIFWPAEWEVMDFPDEDSLFSLMSQPASWNDYIRRAEELRRRIAELYEALRDNPLVADAALIDQIARMLADWDLLQEYVLALAEEQIPDFEDPEVLARVVCLLIDIIEFLLREDRGMNGANRQALRDFVAELKELKELMKEASEELETLVEKLRELIEAAKELAEDPLGFLADRARDRLLERLRDALIRRFGASVVNPVLSILSTMGTAADAILKANSIAELERQANLLVLQGIAAQPAEFNTRRDFILDGIPARFLSCSVRFGYKRVCFVPTPGGQPGEGSFTEFDLPFADGSDTRTVPIGPGRFRVSSVLSAAHVTCPPGAGPCYVVVYYEIICPDGTGTSQGSPALGTGAIRCP